jgi:hypothetical protein
MKDFRGLIPGALGNLAAFSPSGFYRAFTMGNYPDCIKISLRTKDKHNNEGVQSEYVAVGDILNEINPDNMTNGNPVNGITDPCKFKDYTHPITNAKKTKKECEPTNEEDFSSLKPATNAVDSDESDDDAGHSHPDETAQRKEERAALKRMRKMRRKEKKMHHQVTETSMFGVPISSEPDKTYLDPDTDFSSKYEVMRFDNHEEHHERNHIQNGDYKFPNDDIISKLYYAAITGVGLYILYKILYTTRGRRRL